MPSTPTTPKPELHALSRAQVVSRANALITERDEAVRLLEYALTICMYGERAPGGDESWETFGRECETFLRSIDGSSPRDSVGLADMSAATRLMQVREILADVPPCDKYSADDAITCGWKSAVDSIRFVIKERR